MVKDLLDKISSYNIFNFLLPGILFAFVASSYTSFNLIQENNIFGAFLYYFIGMVVSRFGSLVLEPVLKKLKFVTFRPYKQYVGAAKKDERIEFFSEVNNTYRSLMSVFVLLLLLRGYDLLAMHYEIPKENSICLLVILLFLSFLFSYRKQTSYIVQRVDATKE